MSESKSLVKLQRLILMSDSDVEAAADRQLMQLSDDDNKIDSSSGSNGDMDEGGKARMMMKIKKKKKRFFEESDQGEITCTAMVIEEIFGKEEEVSRPIKKRRYRFLESIYRETKPLKVRYNGSKNICFWV